MRLGEAQAAKRVAEGSRAEWPRGAESREDGTAEADLRLPPSGKGLSPGTERS